MHHDAYRPRYADEAENTSRVKGTYQRSRGKRQDDSGVARRAEQIEAREKVNAVTEYDQKKKRLSRERHIPRNLSRGVQAARGRTELAATADRSVVRESRVSTAAQNYDSLCATLTTWMTSTAMNMLTKMLDTPPQSDMRQTGQSQWKHLPQRSDRSRRCMSQSRAWKT